MTGFHVYTLTSIRLLYAEVYTINKTLSYLQDTYLIATCGFGTGLLNRGISPVIVSYRPPSPIPRCSQ